MRNKKQSKPKGRTSRRNFQDEFALKEKRKGFKEAESDDKF